MAKRKTANNGWFEEDVASSSSNMFKQGLRSLKVETGEIAKEAGDVKDNAAKSDEGSFEHNTITNAGSIKGNSYKDNAVKINESSVEDNAVKNSTVSMQVTMGEPWTPEECTRESLIADHLFDLAAEVKDRTKRAAFRLLTEGCRRH